MATERHGKGWAGITSVPEKSGAWGWLLPVGKERGTSTPSGHDHVVEISPACLRLVPPRDSMRGYGAAVAYLFGLLMSFTAINFIVKFDPAGRGYGQDFFIFATLYFVLALVGLITALKLTFALVPDTVIISRRLRRMCAWEKKAGWIAVDYDQAVPYVANRMIVTTTGAGALYPLRVAQLWPGSRRVKTGVTLTSPFASPQLAGEVWEFIRCYMDGEPAQAPPVALIPDHRANAYAWMDRELFSDSVDRRHRLKGGLQSVAFWFFGSMYYVPNWLEYWIRCHGRRPALPAELAESMKWEGENPYPIIPPTPEERLAIEGKLPHMLGRWRLVSVFGLLIWVALPIGFVSVFAFFL
ncbi:hypothetical protein [Achromobacter xylosoxidans]|uniref:hypothetical protein n=1 Tax=Alcaligenes xylosoxydans xylosoxydans TaxID=85698 RepID=UPI001F143EAF|nr:hypothetical protein [Achromobacter xylosoxidans]